MQKRGHVHQWIRNTYKRDHVQREIIRKPSQFALLDLFIPKNYNAHAQKMQQYC